MGQAITAVVEDIGPDDSRHLFQEACSPEALRLKLSSDEDERVDETLMQSLAECYEAASSWETRRQILSIMVDKVKYSVSCVTSLASQGTAIQRQNAISWSMEEVCP